MAYLLGMDYHDKITAIRRYPYIYGSNLLIQFIL
ncbi:hypothetical protein Halxa_0216 (plasmid) [Halopiger xanaduensis SH-6]|uniref:Uncharacterized protein n=1 Tax=Halopiger xanaduensis (strain DSM 18323 / JCM 14033 / SH-6) TaxID=797210 RepID=F8DEL9_HALXS|nr:hypothetical protein Halxa_0216 [Halopiger xanaduensis SH-6]